MIKNFEQLPKPIGDFVVGITQKEFKYESNNEDRCISVIIYYPADSTEGKDTYPYAFPELFGGDKSGKSIMKTKTHCYPDVPISDHQEDYPVLIYNHGYGCFEMINTVLCSDLASSGYIVACVGHPYEASAIRYPDGRIVKMKQEYIEPMVSGNLNEKLEPLLTEMKNIDVKDDEVFIEKGREFFALQDCFNCRMDTWVEDTIRTADFLEKLNNNQADSVLCGRLRLEKGIGLTGHSYGGSTAVQACHDDSRFVCGINIDGGDFGYNYGRDIKKPFLTIGNPHLWMLVRAIFVNNSEDSYHLTVKNADHMGFTDYLFIAREQQDGGRLGDRDPYDFKELLITYHLRFFEKYLLEKDVEFKDLGFKDTDFYEKRRK